MIDLEENSGLVQNALEALVPELKRSEGFRAKPYQGPGASDVPTIGYGTTVYPSGESVKLSDACITEEVACKYLKHDVVRERLPLMRSVLKITPTANQLAAMLSLNYNIGNANFKKSSVLRYFNLANFTKAASSFLLWNKDYNPKTGKYDEIVGLTKRRQREAALFRKV